MKPKWSHFPEQLVANYQLYHPLEKLEDAERLTGVEMLRERFGKGKG